MRCTTLALLSLSTLTHLVESAPFLPGDGSLQKARRRAVDYPLHSEEQNVHARRVHKRDVPYSVVQVNGDAQAATTVEQPPLTVTDIRTASPAVQTLTVTTTVAGVASPLVVTQTIQAPAVIAESLPTPSTIPDVIYKTIVETRAAIPTSSVHYYDDGMWHTYYPIKSWTPPTTTLSTSTLAPTQVLTAEGSAAAVAAADKRSLEAESNSEHKHERHRRGHGVVEALKGGLTHTEEEGFKRFMEETF